jgi:subtilase family serine protease
VAFYVDGERIDTTVIGMVAGESSIAQIRWELAPGDHTIEVIIDPDDQIDESNENNNDARKLISVVELKPDLEIVGYNIMPSEIYAGDEVYINFTMKNSGDTQSGDFTYTIYLDGELFEDPVQMPSLIPGETRTSFTHLWIAEPGGHTFIFVVDEPDQIGESDETNNIISASINVAGEKGVPDLEILPEDITYLTPPDVEESVILATIHNIGNAYAAEPGTDEITIRFSVDGEELYRFIPGIEAGGTSIAEILYNLSPGDHIIRVVIDPYNGIEESNENNNEATKEIVVE